MQAHLQVKAVLKRAVGMVGDHAAVFHRATDRRTRLASSAAIVVGLHAVFLWVLVAANPQMMALPPIDEAAIDTELYTVEPVPETLPEPVPIIKPREVEPVETPQVAQSEQPTEPLPVPEAYKPLPKPVPVQRDTVDAIRKPDARKPDERAFVDKAIVNPSLEPERSTTNLQAKKKEDEGRLEARSQLSAAPGVNTLNLHETPSAVMPSIAPSGLASEKSGKPGQGAPPAGGASVGGLKGGRSGISQALMNHESCVALQQAGKPIPADCNMKALSQMTRVGTGDPAGRAYYGPIVAKKEADDRYKTRPGNTDYWNRVNKVPSVQDKVDRAPAARGTYSSPKAQRVLGECSLDKSCD